MMITIRQLRYFEALARCLHFGHAAQECAVTQPALSMQIKELEETLGVVLIERQTTRIALTPNGEDVLEKVQAILEALRDLEDYSQNKQDILTGNFRLGVIPTVAPYLLPKALPELKKRFPELKLNIRESLTETLVQELKQNRLDVTLLALPIEDNSTLTSYPLFKDRFLLASPTSMKKPRNNIEAAELINSQQLLLLEDGHCLRDQTINFCRSVKVDNLSAFGATSLATLIQMVANGQGMTLLPELAKSSEIRSSKRIRLTHFSEPEPFRMIGLVWRRSSPLQSHFKAFGELLKHISKKVMRYEVK